MQETLETWVRTLDWEDALEKKMAIYSSILAWEIPWTEEPSGLQATGSQELDTTEWLASVSSVILACSFLFFVASLSGFGIRVMVAS